MLHLKACLIAALDQPYWTFNLESSFAYVNVSIGKTPLKTTQNGQTDAIGMHVHKNYTNGHRHNVPDDLILARLTLDVVQVNRANVT